MTEKQQQQLEELMNEYVSSLDKIRKDYRQKIEKILDDIDAIKLEQIKRKLNL